MKDKLHKLYKGRRVAIVSKLPKPKPMTKADKKLAKQAQDDLNYMIETLTTE